MNVNKLFKIVAVLFICTALAALVITVIALAMDSKSGAENDPGQKTEATEKPGKTPVAAEDEALGGTATDQPKESPKKDSASETGTVKTDDTDAGSKPETVEPEGISVEETTPETPDTTPTDDTPVEIPTRTAEGLPIGQSVPKEKLKFDGTETHFVLQNIEYQVNVRKEASKSSDKVGELLKGSYGVVLEKGEEFSLVQCGDLTGYILNTYLMTGRAADEQIQGTSSRKVRIDKAVFIRDDANMESNKLATASAGAEYSFDPTAPEVHGWVAIVFEDAPKAYVSAAFCTVE